MEVAFSATPRHGGGEETLHRGCVEASDRTFIPCGHMRGLPDFYYFLFFFPAASLHKPYVEMEAGIFSLER